METLADLDARGVMKTSSSISPAYSNCRESLRSHQSHHKTIDFLMSHSREGEPTSTLQQNTSELDHLKKIKCSLCSAEIAIRTMANHMENIHKQEDGSYQPLSCKACDRIFESGEQLRNHMLTHDPKKHSCTICDKPFKTVYSLQKHLSKHKEIEKQQSQYREGEEEAPGSSQQGQQNDLSTSEHPSTELLQCDHCDKLFKLKRSLTLHTKHAHVNRIKCSLCSSTFATTNRLGTHMATKHKQEDGSYKPLQCKQCNKVFQRPLQLRKHQIFHNKPYSCTFCGKGFAEKRRLEKHQRKHHQNEKQSAEPTS